MLSHCQLNHEEMVTVKFITNKKYISTEHKETKISNEPCTGFGTKE